MTESQQAHALATAVARALSGDRIETHGVAMWQVAAQDMDHVTQTLTYGGREVLTMRALSAARDKGRIEFSIRWPYDPTTRQTFAPKSYDPGTGTTVITVADTKTPKQIAQAITSRLLPDGLKAWNTQEARRLAEADDKSTREATIKRIAAATRSSYHAGEHGRESTIHIDGPIYNVQIDARSVSFHLRSVSVDDAIAIINLVNAHGVK